MKKVEKIFVLILSLFVVECISYYRQYINHSVTYVAKNNYLDGNISFSNDYHFDENRNLIYNILPNTKVSDFLSKITTEGTFKVFDKGEDGTELTDTTVVKSGNILKGTISGSDVRYRISVKGDVLGEGTISREGAIKAAEFILNSSALSDDVYVFAADYDGSGEVHVNDVALMMKAIDGVVASSYSASFNIQDTKAVTGSSQQLSCDVADGSSSCTVTAPNVSAKSGYTVIGWNTNKDATEASVSPGDTVTLTRTTTYYLITKENKEYKATFAISKEGSASASATSVSCYRYNGASSCKGTSPVITALNNNSVVGWNKNKDATEAEVLSGAKFDIIDGTTYYSIVKKTITITFDVNKDYNDNPEGVSDEEFDAGKVNKQADSLEYTSKQCISYNDEGCYIDDLPNIFSNGNYINGFFSNDKQYTFDLYNDIEFILEMKFTKNTKFYTRIISAPGDSDGVFDVATSYKVGDSNMVIEFEKGLDANKVIYYSNFINEYYSKMPEVFYGNSKVVFLSDDTFAELFQDGNDDMFVMGITFGFYFYNNIAIRAQMTTDEERAQLTDNQLATLQTRLDKITLYSLAHEFGHAFDNSYGAYVKNFLGNRIRNHEDIVGYYNSFKNMQLGTRPLGSYAVSSEAELWAEMFANYYYYKYGDYNDMLQFVQYNELPEDRGKYITISNELVNTVDKYLCISRNGYNEEAADCAKY